jgi:hypothetical protein
LTHSLGLDFDENMLAQASNGLLMAEYRHGRFLAEKARNLPELEPRVAELIEPWLGRVGY